MKCPKCHYLSFDPEPRCKNCGYDLELSDGLALRTAEGSVEGPLADLSLREADPPRRAPITLELIRSTRVASGPDGASAGSTAAAVAEAPPPPPAAPSIRRGPARPVTPTSELPLFVKGLPLDMSAPSAPPAPARVAEPVVPPRAGLHDNDEPLVKVPTAPRPPLAVRRSSPEPPRMRPASPGIGGAPRKLGPLDRDLLEDLTRMEEEQAWAEGVARTAAQHLEALSHEDASVAARLAAAAIDALLLGAIGSVVVFATLRLCGLDFGRINALPPLPMAAFLLVVTLGYLLMFTIAGGQTLGKMAMGIRVVGSSPLVNHEQALTMRQAAFRELLSVPSVFALGAGYIPAVLGRGQAFHDRIAETRVVRA